MCSLDYTAKAETGHNLSAQPYLIFFVPAHVLQKWTLLWQKGLQIATQI